VHGPKQSGNVCWACSTPSSLTEVSEDVGFVLHFCMIDVVLKTICAIVLTGERLRLFDSGSYSSSSWGGCNPLWFAFGGFMWLPTHVHVYENFNNINFNNYFHPEVHTIHD